MVMHVYEAIAAITASLSKVGIAKGRKTQQGGGASFAFRGIDDVLNALSPLLAEHKLCIFPRITDRATVERQTKSGGALFYTTVSAAFDFVSAVDGSKHTAETIGEAMDSGDKSTNKAMSIAYKYAVFLTFCVPIEGTPDADSEVHEVSGARPLDESTLTDLLNNIADAGSKDELLAAFKLACKVAKEANDERALERIVLAKDAAKEGFA
jgi:hypothetical protein